jgi:hypothetical protein
MPAATTSASAKPRRRLRALLIIRSVGACNALAPSARVRAQMPRRSQCPGNTQAMPWQCLGNALPMLSAPSLHRRGSARPPVRVRAAATPTHGWVQPRSWANGAGAIDLGGSPLAMAPLVMAPLVTAPLVALGPSRSWLSVGWLPSRLRPARQGDRALVASRAPQRGASTMTICRPSMRGSDSTLESGSVSAFTRCRTCHPSS